MKQYKRMLALLLALVMVLSLVACGNDDTPETTNGTPNANEETQGTEQVAAEFDPRTITEGVTLTIAVAADDEVTDWETNLVTQMIEEEFGVDLQFEVYASADFTDKMNLMVQGGDHLPDIIISNGSKGLNDQIKSWSSAGAIIPLNEYYENPDYAKYINMAVEKEGWDFVSTMKDADGNLWGMPKYVGALNDATAYRLWINEEYAAACGFDEMPTTTEEFFELCKAFAAAGDLNGNGLDDEVIFTGKSDIDEYWFRFLMSSFVYSMDDKYLDVENGELRLAYTTEEWKEGLKYIKQFFDEGLLDTTILTQDSSAQNAIIRDPETVCLAQINYYPQMQMGTTAETMKARLGYDYVPCLQGPSGRMEAYYSDPLAYPGGVITVDCENPEAAFIIMDYMCSYTVSIYNRFGQEGVDWDWYDNVDDSKFPNGTTKDMYLNEDGTGSVPEFISYTNDTYWGKGNPQNAGYMNAGPRIEYSSGVGRAMVGGETEEAKASAEWWNFYFLEMIPDVLQYKPEERIITLPLTEEEDNSISEMAKVIKNYFMEAGANFITGAWDIDEDWDTYLAEMEKMGVNELLEVYQTAYDRTK